MHRGLPGPEDNMAASISIFSSKVQSFMAAMGVLWVLRRKVRGMSQKTCCGPRLMVFPVSVISSMLAMAGLSEEGKEIYFYIQFLVCIQIFCCHFHTLSSKR